MNPPIQPTAEEAVESIGLPIEAMHQEKGILWVGVKNIEDSPVMLVSTERLKELLSSREKEAYQRGREEAQKEHNCKYDEMEYQLALAAYSASQDSKKECGCAKCLKALE